MEKKGLGKRINFARKDRNFTADRLSELCNINATYLRQIEGGTVRIVNSAVYAMQMLQGEMSGEAEASGLVSDDDVMALVSELRNENENAWGL